LKAWLYMPDAGSRKLLLIEGILILALAVLATSIHSPMVRADSSLSPDPSLVVTCVDGGNARLPGVAVTVTPIVSGPSFTQTTNSSGVTTFALIGNSNYTVAAVYKGTRVSYVPLVSLQVSDVTLGLTCTVFDWVVKVYDSAWDETIAGAKVSIDSATTSDSSISDALGRAVFSNEPQGLYTVTVRYQGLKIGERVINLDSQGREDSMNTTMFDLTVGCLDVSERPAVGVAVKLWNSTGVLLGEKQTGLDGRATFKNLPGLTQYRAEAFFQGKSIGSLPLFFLNKDGFLQTMSLQLARLILTVKDYNGVNTMSNLDLKASAYLGGQLVVESSSLSGDIDLGSLVLGTYSVNVTFGNVTVASFLHTLTKESQQRTVNANFYDVTARVDASELLNSAQAQNLRMRLEYDTFAAESSVGVSGDALFQNVPPATCRLTLLKGGIVVGSGLVAVSSQDQLLPSMKPTTYNLSLRVVNAELQPLFCSVRLVEVRGIPIATLESNQSGAAVFPRILGLTYDVSVICKGYVVARQDVRVSQDTFLQIVAKVYRIAVRLTDFEGSTPMQGATIEATAQDLVGTETRVTDSQGKAVFQDMPSADYLLTAKFMNVRVSATSVTLRANENITFSSPGIYDMTVRCLDADGNQLNLGELQVLLAGKEVERGSLDETGLAEFINLPNTTYQILAFLYKEQVGTASVALDSQGQVVQLETVASTLRIKLSAADNTTIVDANVTVLKDGRRIASKTPSPPDPRTSFTLPPGSYRILVYYQDRSVSDVIEAHRSSKDLEIPCTVYRCRVKAIDLRHEPIQGTEIYISEDTDTFLSIVTNSSGLAEFYLAGGQHTWRIVIGGRSSSRVVNTQRNVQILLLNVQDQPSLAAVAAAGSAIPLLLLAASLYLRRRTKMGATGVREKRFRPQVPRV